VLLLLVTGLAAVVALAATGPAAPAGAISGNVADCSFNGTASSPANGTIGVIKVSAGSQVSVACNNMSPQGLAVAADESSPLLIVAECNGGPCSSSDQQTLAENEADLSAAQYETCFFGCGSSWSTTFTVPSPFKSGGSTAGGAVSASGDPNAVCPPTQQQVNMGLIACGLGVADTNGDIWGAVFSMYTSPSNPAPQAPTLQLTTSSAAPGQVVGLSDVPCTPSQTTVCPYWWGDPIGTAPNAGGSYQGVATPPVAVNVLICPASGGGSCTDIPNDPSNPVVTISPPVYNFDTSSDTGTWAQYPKLQGSITIPSTLSPGNYTVQVYETNALGVVPGNSTNPSYPNALFAEAPLTVTQGSSSGSSYNPLPAPARICDTRSIADVGGKSDVVSGVSGQCANSGTALSKGTTLSVQVGGVAGVPASGVSGVVLNVTAVGASAPGYLTIFPGGPSILPPMTSNLNFSAGAAVPNLVTVGLGSSGAVDVVTNVASVNVVVDVAGYYGSPAQAGAGLYNPLTPARIADTRCGQSPPPSFCSSEQLPAANLSLSTLGPNSTVAVTVTGVGNVPSSGVSAVVLNVTVTGGTSGSYLTLWPAGASQPTASNLNWTAGETVPNRVVVAVGQGGKVDVYNKFGSVNVIIDVNGYMSAAGGTGKQFFALPSPVRIADTRCGQSPPPSFCSSEAIPTANAGLKALPAGGTITVQVAGVDNIPADAAAVVANVTVTQPSASSYLTIWPGGPSRPTVSDLNFVAGETVPNLVQATLSSGSGAPAGSISVYNYAGTVQVIVDVTGWFA
jgi:hypothetical protein